ncbi:MAG: hypothetical protein U1E39_19405 [Planctomycetota bacterium]
MPALLLLAAWISGTAALVAETIWFRALGRGVGTSAEALAVVSASFLGGLGLGAAIASRRAPTARSPLRAAAVCEGVAGLLVALSPFALAVVPDAHLALLALLGATPGPSAWPAALVALPILVVPTAFLGATLPLLVRGRVRALASAGRWTGLLYGVNTFGAACGTVAGLVLLDRLGERGALALAGAGNLLAALALLAADGVAGRAAKADDAAAPAARAPLPPPAARPARAPLGRCSRPARWPSPARSCGSACSTRSRASTSSGSRYCWSACWSARRSAGSRAACSPTARAGPTSSSRSWSRSPASRRPRRCSPPARRPPSRSSTPRRRRAR